MNSWTRQLVNLGSEVGSENANSGKLGNNRQHAEEGNSQGIKESEQTRALGMDQGKGFHLNPEIDGKWGRFPSPRD